jgi:hypothetical protein
MLGDDGKWTALDGRDLFPAKFAMDAIYLSTLEHILTRDLGVERRGWWQRRDRHQPRQVAEPAPSRLDADLAAAREVAARRALQEWEARMERTAPERARLAAVNAELGDRVCKRRSALAIAPPAAVTELLGAYPAAAPAEERRAWARAAEQITDYRERHGLAADTRGLGERPRLLAERRAWEQLRDRATAIRQAADDIGRYRNPNEATRSVRGQHHQPDRQADRQPDRPPVAQRPHPRSHARDRDQDQGRELTG